MEILEGHYISGIQKISVSWILGSVTGHSRGDVYSCVQGGGTITDVKNTFQGWLKCSFEAAGAPLDHLKDDASKTIDTSKDFT